MSVTAESQSQYRAFRRLIYNLSKQLSQDEAQAVVYIHFFDQKDALKSASTLDILCKLESTGTATASNPEKLMELMKDLKRNDLVSEVKDFMKKKRTRTTDRERKGSGLSLGRKPQPRLVIAEEVEELESEEDLILRNTLEAAVVQATVLLQHMEMIQSSISGNKIKRGAIGKTVTEAAQTCEALAERLRRAELRLNQEEGQQWLSSGSYSNERETPSRSRGGSDMARPVSSASDELDRDNYINMAGTGPFREPEGVAPSQRGHDSTACGQEDGYSKVISSVPTKPASYYASATPPSNNRQTDNRPQSPSKDEDDDDYEPMNPAALSVEKWLEVKRTILGGGNDYSIPRPQPRTGTEHNLSPVQYSSLAISPSAATSTASQTQTAPGSRDSASTSSRPFAYTSVAKPDFDSTSSSLPPGHRQRSTHISTAARGRQTKSALIEGPNQATPTTTSTSTDDNYTTFHSTSKEQLQDDAEGPAYFPLDRNCVMPPGVYTSVQHQDYQ